MSHQRCQSPGTGLRDVFDILREAPPERLLSLTFQLGDSPEEKVIQALCQVVLQRPEQALHTLQMLEDDSLACHLAERWQTGGFDPEGFGDHCGRFQALTGETLAALARIFRVLTQQRLCDQLQRNLAYKRAMSSDCQKTATYNDLCYDQFREEAKDVCGPEVQEWLCSYTESSSYSSSGRPLDGTNPTLKLCDTPLQAASRSLHSSSSVPSFPTHLEISSPPTISFPGDRLASQVSGNHMSSLPSVITGAREAENAPASAASNQCAAKRDSVMDETPSAMSCNSNFTPQKTSPSNVQPKCAQPAVTHTPTPKTPTPKETHEGPEDEEEEEERFFAFVILHAPDDTDVAESMKEKLEEVAGNDGATFSGDFAIPGKSTLKCVEDAINNSAFTFLLLTRNFNTRMLDIKTNTALMNSINKEHKYNTVIPLLPRENCMPRPSIPLVLQSIVPLEENRSFERKIQRLLSSAKIEKQRRKWTEERVPYKQKDPQQAQVESLRLSTEQNLRVSERWPHAASICIQNANYIMIGNDSQMTVGVGEGADKQDAV